jgi:hypothetical protein
LTPYKAGGLHLSCLLNGCLFGFNTEIHHH